VSVNSTYPNQQMNQNSMMRNQNMMNQPNNNRPANYNYSNNNGSNSNAPKFDLKIIITVFIILILVVGGIFSFQYFQNLGDKREELENEEIRKEVEDNIEDSEEKRQQKAEQMKKNINLAEDHVLYDGSLLFTYENNNNAVVAVELEIEFYDSENNFLGTAKEYAYPAPFSKFLIKFNVLKLKEGYASYEIKLNVSDYDLKPVSIDTSKFIINDTGQSILVQYPNTGTEKIDNLELCILYRVCILDNI
jgi:flagellar basal body-associated protein FliL